jgi:hypothetical protein
VVQALGGEGYDGQESQKVTFARNSGSWPGEGYVERSYSGKNFKSGGGKALNFAYKVSANPPTHANDDVFVEIVSSAGTGRVVIPGDITGTDWTYFYTALQDYEDDGADPCDVDNLRLGFKADASSGAAPQLLFDAIGRCGAQCVAELLKPDADVTGDCLVDWDDMDIVFDNWLEEDYYIYPEAPCSPNLIVALEFNGDFSDSSGNGYNTRTYGSPVTPTTYATFNGINQWVELYDLNSVNPFDGFNGDYSISVTFRTTEPGILISSSRDIVSEEGTTDTHSMSLFIWDWGQMQHDSWWNGGVSNPDETALDGEWQNVVDVFDDTVDSNDMIMYVDGLPGGPVDLDPNIPNSNLDTIAIATSMNLLFPNEDGVPQFFDGDIDFVRVYDYPLTLEQAMYETTGSTTPVEVGVDPDANQYVDGAFGTNIIDFLDYAEVAEEWLVGPLQYPDDLGYTGP